MSFPKSHPPQGPARVGVRGRRIQLDGSRTGADGQDTQGRAVAEGAWLVREAMLHRLVKLEQVPLEPLPHRVVPWPQEPPHFA